MRKSLELNVDVTEAAGLDQTAEIAATVFLPDALSVPAVVCFGFPGAGYSRRYYSFDMPGSGGGGQAGFHCDRGWIFVACDHLGVGDSTLPEADKLSFDNIAAANDAAVRAIMAKLAAGTLCNDYPPVIGAIKLGFGQSMGAGFTIVAQGQLATFDGVGILGYSAIRAIVPWRPGTPKPVWPWFMRGGEAGKPKILNQAAVDAAAGPTLGIHNEAAETDEHPFAWAFHFDGEPADIVALDMAGAAGVAAVLPAWRSASIPACSIALMTPGVVASEAAAITVPVLVAMGERDVVPDPWMESKAYPSATDVTLFICPAMAHMHNFARTRLLFWQRLQSWGSGVAMVHSRPEASSVRPA